MFVRILGIRKRMPSARKFFAFLVFGVIFSLCILLFLSVFFIFGDIEGSGNGGKWKVGLPPGVKIDFVYTYVNGSDPLLLSALRKLGEYTSESRIRDFDTMKYSFRSIQKYAPWFNNLYLVLANRHSQIPGWLNTSNPRLKIITHDQIFPFHSHLPSFNSHSIESHLWRIPQLSEYFVYFNDDILLGDTVTPGDFFAFPDSEESNCGTEDIPKDELVLKIYPDIIVTEKTVSRVRMVFRFEYELLKGRYGDSTSIFTLRHTPQVFKKSVLQDLWSEFRVQMLRTSSHHVRKPNDIPPLSLFYHYLFLEKGHVHPIAFVKSNWILDYKLQYILLNGKLNRLKSQLVRWNFVKPKFICLNDNIKEMDDGMESYISLVIDHLNNYYKTPSEFENTLKDSLLTVKVTNWHAVANWEWIVDEECCGICRYPFDGVCPDCQQPGDDCPPAWGQCTHVYHMHCIMKWVNQQNNEQLCPMCRQNWEFVD